jgi:HEPN domain-containing protein
MDKIEPMEEIKNTLKQMFPGIEAHIDRIAEFFKTNRIAFNADETSRKLGIAFLHEADRDITSCRALYSKKIYAHAVYHLQQAVEKAMKGYCIGLGMLSIGEVKAIKHDTPYVLLEALFEKTGLRKLLEISSQDIKTQFDRANQSRKDPQERLKIARMPFDEIVNTLILIDLYGLLNGAMHLQMSQLAANVKAKSASPPPQTTALSIAISLYLLGTVSFPHEQFARYPGEAMTPPEYVPELGVVKATDKILDYLLPAITDLTPILLQQP